MTPPAGPVVHRLRVCYSECDMQGIVFNTHYYAWMDLAHQELIREVLGRLEVLIGLGVDVVVAESSARHVGVQPGDLTKRPWPDEVRAAFTPLLPPPAPG